jgi:hypothetical protein
MFTRHSSCRLIELNRLIQLILGSPGQHTVSLYYVVLYGSLHRKRRVGLYNPSLVNETRCAPDDLSINLVR